MSMRRTYKYIEPIDEALMMLERFLLLLRSVHFCHEERYGGR